MSSKVRVFDGSLIITSCSVLSQRLYGNISQVWQTSNDAIYLSGMENGTDVRLRREAKIVMSFFFFFFFLRRSPAFFPCSTKHWIATRIHRATWGQPDECWSTRAERCAGGSCGQRPARGRCWSSWRSASGRCRVRTCRTRSAKRTAGPPTGSRSRGTCRRGRRRTPSRRPRGLECSVKL